MKKNLLLALGLSLVQLIYTQTGTDCNNTIPAVKGSNAANHVLTGPIDQYYHYTVSENCILHLTSCGIPGGEDTWVTLYSGNDCITSDSVAENDDSECGLQSEIFYTATAGEQLFMVWWGYYFDVDASYNWTLEEITNALPGEYCLNANTAQTGTNLVDHTSSDIAQWYKYTVTQDALVSISTCNETEDTYLELYLGTDCSDIEFNKSSNDDCSLQSKITYQATAGEILFIKCFPDNVTTGNTYTLTIEEITETPAGSSCNDPYTAIAGVNTANHQTGTWNQWYTYTASQNGFISISTCGNTEEDTYVEVYKGNLCSNLEYIDESDDACNYQSSVFISASIGEKFYIKWLNEYVPDSYTWDLEEITTIPQGISCKNPFDANLGSNASTHSTGITEVWYKYTATQDGKISITSQNITEDIWIGVLQNGCLNDSGTFVSYDQYSAEFWTKKDEVYFILVENFDLTDFNFIISETAGTPPIGMSCDNTLTAIEGKQTAAHSEGNQWYTYTPSSNGWLTISSCETTLEDTYVEIYDACKGTLLDLSDDYCNSQSLIELEVTGGTDYKIAWYNHFTNVDIEWELSFESSNTIELATTTTNANCGKNNGSATVTVSGGTAPYTYQWSNGQFEATANNLSAGIYMITVKDANSEEAFAAVTINNTGGLNIAGSTTNVSCFEGTTGAINITVSGGSSPYTFEWSNGAITEDISNLPSGPYEVIVKDNNQCMMTKQFVVTQPAKIIASVSKNGASCSKADGSAEITVSGGVAPYSYNWSNMATTSNVNDLAAGLYSVTISDASGCQIVKQVQISDKNAPTIKLDNITLPSCGGSDASIQVTVSGGASPYNFKWSNDAITEDLSNVSSGTYNLMVTDNNNCKAIMAYTIEGEIPDLPEICMITVDSASGKNMIVWEKGITSGISHYNIYKEATMADVYNKIGTVLVNDLSLYIDSFSNPRIRSWRYKISAVDACGNESKLSEAHKTIHLVVNPGLSGENNIIWDYYQGYEFFSYSIYRYSTSEGWKKLDDMPSNLFSYIDFNPLPDTKKYYVSVEKANSCTATDNKKANAGPFSRSISNLEDNRVQSSGTDINNNTITVNIFPNPAGNNVLITANDYINQISIIDISGKTLSVKNNFETKAELDLSSLENGIYFIQLSTDKGQITKKIIKQ